MIRIAAAFCLIATTGNAVELRFPSNAEMTMEAVNSNVEFALPAGVWDGSSVPVIAIEGDVTQQSWQIAAKDLTLVQLIRPLREQLRNEGFEVLFECETKDCGGFDFRFSIDVLPPPDMFVNLANFRQLSAWRTLEDGTEEAVALLVSRSGEAGFIQFTHVGERSDVISNTGAPALQNFASDAGLAAGLEAQGRAILQGLTFERGSARLADGGEAVLQELADTLAAQPDLQVALVGHTDAEGSLDGNIALSKRRAASVLERLVADYGVSRQRMEAQGMGYLSPIANNQSAEGRDANRRVEVIITSTD